MAGTTSKRTACWIVQLLLVLVPSAGSGIAELFESGLLTSAQDFRALGYPLYLMKITGLGEICGAIVLLLSPCRLLVEWAHAHCAFVFLGATASQLVAGTRRAHRFHCCSCCCSLGAYPLHRLTRKTRVA